MMEVIALYKFKKPRICVDESTGSYDNFNTTLRLPEGCTGIMFVFESKRMARQYFGPDAKLLRIEMPYED